jgi:uncharacterized protein (DUF2236 family)
MLGIPAKESGPSLTARGEGAPFPDGRDASGVAWKIHSERALLLGWGRAILLQFAHPLVARGVAEHSGFLREPRGRVARLRRTLQAMLVLTFGEPSEAFAVGARITAIHDRVHGRLAEPAGKFRAGTFYSARDPALLRWVHATLLDSFLLAYETFVGPLDPGEKDRYCRESSALETLFLLPRGYLPRTLAELRSYMGGMYSGGEIEITETARALAAGILDPGFPRAAAPLVWIMRLATVGLLPPRIREDYGLAWGPADECWLRVLAAAVRGSLRFSPPAVRRWRLARVALRRANGASRAGSASKARAEAHREEMV